MAQHPHPLAHAFEAGRGDAASYGANQQLRLFHYQLRNNVGPTSVEDLQYESSNQRPINQTMGGLRKLLRGVPVPLSMREVKEAIGGDILTQEERDFIREAEANLPRQTYLPLEPSRIPALLLRDYPDVFAADPGSFSLFAGLCSRMLHLCRSNTHNHAGSLLEAYEPFNPDEQNDDLFPYDERRHATFDGFKRSIGVTLEAAGFRPVSRMAMDRALSEKSSIGICVRRPPPTSYESVIYARGVGREKMPSRILGWFRCCGQPKVLPTYENVIVVFRVLKQATNKEGVDHLIPGKLYLKTYRDFVQVDIDMLLPAINIIFSWWDWLFMLVPLAIGIGTSIYHLVQFKTINFQDVTSIVTAAILIVSPFTLFVGVFFKIRTRQMDYLYMLNKTLFLKTMASNEATLNFLLFESAEQEAVEAILAYFFLWRGLPQPQPMDVTTLDGQVEQWLHGVVSLENRTQNGIDFEVLDGTEKLRQLGILSQEGALPNGQPVVRVRPLREAYERISSWSTMQRMFSRTDKPAHEATSFLKTPHSFGVPVFGPQPYAAPQLLRHTLY